jgi:hypothetical protein
VSFREACVTAIISQGKLTQSPESATSMPRHQTRQVPEALIQVQQQLEEWRGTHPQRAKLPEAIWQSAADVAKQCGVYATAKALRLDYGALKKRTLGSATPRRKSAHPKPAQAAFLELIARPVTKVEDYVVEWAKLGERPVLLNSRDRRVERR